MQSCEEHAGVNSRGSPCRALGGGGTVSLRTDTQGKTFGAALLSMEIEVD